MRLMLLYMLPDISESIMKDIEFYMKKGGIPGFKYETKHNWNAFFKDAYKLRRNLYYLSETTQHYFADISELFEELLLLIMDRCNSEDQTPLIKTIECIKSFPSKRNVEINGIYPNIKRKADD